MQKHPWGGVISVQRTLGVPPFLPVGAICLLQYVHKVFIRKVLTDYLIRVRVSIGVLIRANF